MHHALTQDSFDLSVLGLFDHDGLINDIEKLRNRLWPEAAKEFGLPEKTPDDFRVTLGLRSDAVIEAVRNLLVPELDLEEGSKIVNQVRTRRNELVSEYLRENGVPEREGARALLECFEELALPKVLATSSRAEDANPLIDGLKLRERFIAVVTGDQVPRGKPHPDVFEKAYELANEALEARIPKACSLVFEDSNNGAEAGFAGGFPVILLPDLERPKKMVRDSALAVCDSFAQAIEVVREFVNGQR